MRAAIKQALIGHREVPDERWALLPVVPLLPKRLFARMVRVAAGGATSVVSSNLGALNPGTNRADGTDADYFAMKSLYPGITKSTMHRAGGVLVLLSGRAHGQVFVSVLAYRPGSSKDDLRQDLSNTLNDFSLAGTTGWRRPGDALHRWAARSERRIHDERVTPLPPPA
jgi:diacylglycerol O-acyltransferase / wax synthase